MFVEMLTPYVLKIWCRRHTQNVPDRVFKCHRLVLKFEIIHFCLIFSQETFVIILPYNFFQRYLPFLPTVFDSTWFLLVILYLKGKSLFSFEHFYKILLNYYNFYFLQNKIFVVSGIANKFFFLVQIIYL